MREIVTKAFCASLAILLSVGGGALANAAKAAPSLTGDELRRHIPGAKIQLDTPLGSVIPIVYGTDGSLDGRAGAVAFFLGAQKDTGKWWIEGATLCQRWNTWFNGRTNCVRVFPVADNRIEWIDQDGERGTGTIVALSAAAQPATQRPAVVAAAASAAKPAERSTASAPHTDSAAMHASVGTKVVSPGPAARPAGKTPVGKAGAGDQRTAAARAAVAPASSRPAVTPPPAPSKKPAQEAGAGVRVARADGVSHLAASAVPPDKGIPRATHAPTFRVINVPLEDVLNIRNGPDATTRIVATIPPRTGGIRRIGPCEGEWCPVQHGRSSGWVNRYFIAREDGVRGRDNRNIKPSPITYRVARVEAHDVLNLRRKPDPDSAVVGSIPPNGKRIRLTGYCVGEWCPVSHGRTTGWAHRYFLALEF